MEQRSWTCSCSHSTPQENELKKRREEIRTFKRRVSELELSAATAPASASRSVSSRGASSRFRNGTTLDLPATPSQDEQSEGARKEKR